jgi:hypothetical protein
MGSLLSPQQQKNLNHTTAACNSLAASNIILLDGPSIRNSHDNLCGNATLACSVSTPDQHACTSNMLCTAHSDEGVEVPASIGQT